MQLENVMQRSTLFVRYALANVDSRNSWTRWAQVDLFVTKEMCTDDVFRALTTIIENVSGEGSVCRIFDYKDEDYGTRLYNYCGV
jgi:hypothetical protein